MVVYICKFQSPNLCPLPPSCVIHLFSISASLFLSWNRFICTILLLPGSSAGKESACNAGDPGLIPRVRKIPWRRDRVPTPVFRPREFNGQRSLAGYSPKTVGVAKSRTRLSEFPFHYHLLLILWASLVAQTIKNLPSMQETRFDPWVGKIRWRRKRQPTPVFLPGESHGQRSLVGCSPWACKELDRTEWLHFHFSLLCIGEGKGNPLQYSCLENHMDRGA